MKKTLIDIFKINKDKISYVPNFRNIECMPALNKIRNSSDKYKITSADILVGVVGRLHPQKGHQYLLDAIPIIADKFQNVKFIFAGDGPLKGDLINRVKVLNIEDRVVFAGHLNSSEIKLLYNDLNIGVLPSLHEGMPGAVLEYMAMGLPVVATRVDGTKDLVDDGVTGLLVPPQNSKLLAEAIISLLNNPSLAKQMGAAGKKRLEQNFSLQNIGEKIHNLYNELINK